MTFTLADKLENRVCEVLKVRQIVEDLSADSHVEHTVSSSHGANVVHWNPRVVPATYGNVQWTQLIVINSN